MNTVMITGTAKQIGKASKEGISFTVKYDVHFWGSKKGEQLQFVTAHYDLNLSDYSELWKVAKETVAKYFDDYSMEDGAYTQFLDHLTIL